MLGDSKTEVLFDDPLKEKPLEDVFIKVLRLAIYTSGFRLQQWYLVATHSLAQACQVKQVDNHLATCKCYN